MSKYIFLFFFQRGQKLLVFKLFIVILFFFLILIKKNENHIKNPYGKTNLNFHDFSSLISFPDDLLLYLDKLLWILISCKNEFFIFFSKVLTIICFVTRKSCKIWKKYANIITYICIMYVYILARLLYNGVRVCALGLY